jgi:hypothetical protein
MRHIRAILTVLMGISLFMVPELRADSLQLKNGNFVQGKYLGGTERAVQFEVNGKIRLYGIDEILSISFAAASADGGIPSNDGDQRPRTNTGLNLVDSDNGQVRTAVVNHFKPRKPLAHRTSLPQNSGVTRLRPDEPAGGSSGRSNCADLVPASGYRMPTAKVSKKFTGVLRASSPVISD